MAEKGTGKKIQEKQDPTTLKLIKPSTQKQKQHQQQLESPLRPESGYITPLTEDQQKVLARGPNFAIVTKEQPVSKYISQIERMCQQLKGRQKS